MISEVKQAIAALRREPIVTRRRLVLTPEEKIWHDANPGYLPGNVDIIVSRQLPVAGLVYGNGE